MCWMCGCADHIGLGNERSVINKNEDAIIDKQQTMIEGEINE